MKKIKELISYSHKIARQGLVAASSGNISVRHGGEMVIKASGCFMESADHRDFITVDIATLRVTAGTSRPSCEMKMHAGCYIARPDISCVMHTHPFYATILVSCGIKPQTVSLEGGLSVGIETGVLDYICPGTKKLADNVSRQIKKYDLVYLKNHGIIAVGRTVKEAYSRTILAENMAKMQVFSLLLGGRLKKFGKKEIKELLKNSA